jgi:uncharacterized membrane protein
VDLPRLALFAHLLAAFAFVAGYVATNVLTEMARRAATSADRRAALAYAGRFDRLLNAPGGTAVIVTGLAAVWAYGYAITTPWIVASGLLFLMLPLLGGLYWAPFGRQLEAAAQRGDDQAVRGLLNARRNVALSRLENLIVLALLALMVFRPG